MIYTMQLNSPLHFILLMIHVSSNIEELNLNNISELNLNKTLYKDLKELSFWLHANKIALNATKTEVILFKKKRKTNLSKLNLKFCRKKLHPIETARYLGVTVDENLNWKKHVNDISHKLIRVNAILFKIRNYVNQGTLRTVYFGIFHSCISYIPIGWENTNYPQQRLSLLQKKALRIMYFVQFSYIISDL